MTYPEFIAQDLKGLYTITIDQPKNPDGSKPYIKKLGPFVHVSVQVEILNIYTRSVELFLTYLAANDVKDAWRDFPSRMYDEYLKNYTKINNNASLGWYYYYLNELVHYSLETIFWGMLVQMEQKQLTIVDFIETITQSVLEHEGDNFDDLANLTISEVIEIAARRQAK